MTSYKSPFADRVTRRRAAPWLRFCASIQLLLHEKHVLQPTAHNPDALSSSLMSTENDDSTYEHVLRVIRAATEKERKETRDYEATVKFRALKVEEEKLLVGLCSQIQQRVITRNGEI